MSTYLVTGGTGFLGRHLVKILLQQGHQVVALVRREAPELEQEGVTRVRGDVLDGDSIEAAAQGCDGLFHCAGQVSRDPEDALSMLRVHVEGTKTTLDAARRAGIGRVVYVSTSGTIAISESAKPVPDENTATPYGIIGQWPYYRSKLFAEQEALARNRADFEIICVNPSLLLGPGDPTGQSTEDVRLFLEKKIPAVPGGGISYVDVRDAAQTIAHAMEQGKAGERYLLGACNITFAEFLQRLERLSGVSAPWMPAPKNAFFSKVGSSFLRKLQDSLGMEEALDDTSVEMSRYFWYLDSSKARSQLNFAPRDATTTLRDTIHDLVERGLVWPVDFDNPEELLLDSLKNTVRDTLQSSRTSLESLLQKRKEGQSKLKP